MKEILKFDRKGLTTGRSEELHCTFGLIYSYTDRSIAEALAKFICQCQSRITLGSSAEKCFRVICGEVKAKLSSQYSVYCSM